MTRRDQLTIAGIIALLAFSIVAVGLVTGGSASSDGTTANSIEMPGDGMDAGEDVLCLELDADGDTEFIVRTTYDLNDAGERMEFEEMQEEDASEKAKDEHRKYVKSLAEDVQGNTDREMAVTDTEMTSWTAGDEGIIVISVTWEGLAEVNGGEVQVKEPFNSGYETDDEVMIVGPTGYEVTSAHPEMDEEQDESVSWEGVSNDEFEVTFESADDREPIEPQQTTTMGLVVMLFTGIGVVLAAVLKDRYGSFISR